MKILHVIGSLAARHGGPSKACIDMATAVAARGHQVDIFTTDQDGSGRLEVPTAEPVLVRGVRIRYFRSTLRRLWPMSIAMWRSLAHEIAKYDLVHIHSLYLFHGAAAAHYCRKCRVPYILRPHGTLDPFLYKRHRFRKHVYETLIERKNLRSAAAIHFTTEEERTLGQPHAAGAPGFVLPLGLHIEEYANLPAPGMFRAAFPEVAKRRIVLHLGRLNFKKGLDILIGAFANVAGELEDTHLVIAGPDNEGLGIQLRRRLAELGLSRRATFTGMLQGEIKLAAFRDASVFALPSYSENFGIAVVEAMACRVPVVISNRVNIWREVESAGAGLVTECDVDSCAAALLTALKNNERARAMGEKGHELVTARFAWSSVGEKLERIYREIVSGRSDFDAHHSSSVPAIK